MTKFKLEVMERWVDEMDDREKRWEILESLAAMIDTVRAEAFEDAARVADEYYNRYMAVEVKVASRDIAAAIRERAKG
jgi:hypothetical protein